MSASSSQCPVCVAPALLFLASCAGFSFAENIGRPDTAISLALRDVDEIGPDNAAHAFYIWVRDKSDTDLLAGYDYALNIGTSTARRSLRSVKVVGDFDILLRLDLRHWCGTPEDRKRFESTLNEYADPYFYETTTTTETVKGKPKFKTKTIYDSQGRNPRTEKVPDGSEPDTTKTVAKFGFSPALLSTVPDAARLQAATGMKVPVVDASRWLVHSLRTLQGGLYYRLQGFEGLNQKEWLALFGVDEEQSAKLGADEYVAMWQSQVTGKPRRAKFLYGYTRTSAGLPLCVITQDLDDANLDPNQHPIYSLLSPDYDATEILATKPNGLLAFGLFAGDGSLQDSAPDSIVSDHRIPAPYTKRLEPAISCIRCHAGENLWREMPNNLKTLLASGLVIEDGKNDIAALYGGDLTLPLKRARDDQEYAAIAVTDFQLEGDGYAVAAAQFITERFAEYAYQTIGPLQALAELGIQSDDPSDFGKLFADAPGLLTDPVIASLKNNPPLPVNRADWERIYQAALAECMAGPSLNGESENEPSSFITVPDATNSGKSD